MQITDNIVNYYDRISHNDLRIFILALKLQWQIQINIFLHQRKMQSCGIGRPYANLSQFMIDIQ